MALLRLIYCGLLTVSLFNAILLLWLGLTVVLNAVRRNWGIWLAVGGLFAGAAVFVSHAAVLMEGVTILAIQPAELSQEVNAWWPLGWTAIVYTPFAWYIVILWYAGYWNEMPSSFHRRQRVALALTMFLGLITAGLLLVSRPLPFTIKSDQLDISTTPAIAGVPLLILFYPIFALCCTTFSLRALLRPAPELLATAGPARKRARPWLISASLALFAVSLLIGGGMAWFVIKRDPSLLWIVVDPLAVEFFSLDLLVSLLIAAAVLMVGQAVVAYEIFTGKTLPAQGLRRQWVNVVKLALGYSAAIGVTYAVQISAAYVIILATLIIAAAYAVFGWRTYQERQRYISALRPFATSQHFYDSVLSSTNEVSLKDDHSAFAALCRDVLNCRQAYLIPAGALTALVPVPLVYPSGPVPDIHLSEMLAGCDQVSCAIVDPKQYGGAVWVIPLRGKHDIVGGLFLGEKTDGGLYTEEEIEIARSSGERFLDTIAGETLAKRLMALQRQRFVETQVLDQQSRRALHDEILPTLHAAMLTLSGQCAERPESAEAMAQLADVHRRVSRLLREMPVGSASQVSKLGLIPALREMVGEEFASSFEDIQWQIEPEAERQSVNMPSLTADVLFYAVKEAIRNAAKYARGSDSARPVHLTVSASWRDGIEICIADNGVGISPDVASVSGHGLALHSTMLTVIGGSLVAENRLDAGSQVTIFLPQQGENQYGRSSIDSLL